MKLEVGMYVRSKINGLVSKITDIEQFEELGQIIERYILDNNYNRGFYSTEIDSVKASHNIIDLTEVGDVISVRIHGNISKYEVEQFDLKGKIIGIRVQILEDIRIFELKDLDIISILTKEQFKANEYEV